ncbi:suppressor of SWI4 1 homolog isoform X3 [Mus pahari]|uniref:suppressor of SWI4 1 homolog isoform X3 n=1 Tax=Mus pahari TaxID=10093 RepID=UPI0011147DB6|nr:suppressor of SWI4 1 homolog isoform X3 [Mus pahari]
MGQAGRSRHQKRNRAQAQLRNLDAYAAQPHSFVFTRGRAGRSVRQLSLDVRRVMEPLTATRLQVRKKNSLKDCVAVAGPLGVTHFLILSKTDNSVYLVNLNTIKRCLLINYNPDSQELDFRHYSVKVVPVGASRGMKKLLQEKFPNMSRLQDISELLATGVGLSDSEVEPDGEHNTTELPQAVAGRGNMQAQQSAIRLTEIGPRMTLQLIKIQEGVGNGNVLFHSFVHKTEEELQAILAAKEEKLRLKVQRQNQQAENLQRKRELREAHKKKSLAGIKRARARADGDSDAEDPGAPPETVGASQPEDEEDDAEYFRQAVGEEPDEDLFPTAAKRRRQGAPLGKKRRGKEQRPGTKDRGQGGNRRALKPQGRPQRGKTKLRPRATHQDFRPASRRGT